MMFSFTSEDAAAVLKKSNNLNAVLKNFLKREVRPGDTGARFVKDLRAIGDGNNLPQYLEQNREKFENHILAIGRYAHPELTANILKLVVETYADDFNKTYQTKGESIEVTDQKNFDSIVEKATKLIEAESAKAGLEGSQFFKSSMMQAIFEPAVLAQIQSRIR